MAIYRCMEFYLDMSKVVAVTELETKAVARRFAVFAVHDQDGADRLKAEQKALVDAWCEVLPAFQPFAE